MSVTLADTLGFSQAVDILCAELKVSELPFVVLPHMLDTVCSPISRIRCVTISHFPFLLLR